MKSLRYIIYVSALLIAQVVVAQSEAPKITSQLSADTIRIGDRVTLSIDVEKDVMQHVEFPVFNFSQDGSGAPANMSVEVVHDFPVDTISKEGRREHLRKRYELAIYDEGIYNMGAPQVLYIDKNIIDTLRGEKEDKIIVETFQIDTTQTPTVRDIKPQKRLKWHIAEHIGYIAIGLALIALLCGVIFLLNKYLQKRGKRFTDFFRPAPPVPPHIAALAALDSLRAAQLWQNGEFKLYYSALSDILRIYLAGRFEVGAMEMTTDEIVLALRNVELEQKLKMDILAVLRDADLVKFAKATPEAEENEAAFDKVLNFVECTKPVEKVEEAEDEPTKNRKEK